MGAFYFGVCVVLSHEQMPGATLSDKDLIWDTPCHEHRVLLPCRSHRPNSKLGVLADRHAAVGQGALPDRRVSIGQNPKFRVWPMRPAREQHAVLVAGRVPDQIFVGESCPRHLLVREHDTNTKIKSTHPKASASNCYYKVMFFSASCFCTSGCAINSS